MPSGSAQPGDAYTGVLGGVDEAGNLLGFSLDNGQYDFLFYVPGGPGGSAVTLKQVPYGMGSFQLGDIRGGVACGSILDPGVDTHTHAFICRVPAAPVLLPDVLPSDTSALNYDSDMATHVNASGDAVGIAQYHSSGSFGANYFGLAFWHHDAGTDTYSVFDLYALLGGNVLNGTNLQFQTYASDSIPNLNGIADDGTILVEYLNTFDASNPSSKAVVLLKPGPDPRPVVNLPDASNPSFSLRAEPGQPFSYQFTATNNPTAFRLVTDPSLAMDYPLPAGLSFNASTGVLSGAGPALGNYFFFVVATNGRGVGALAVPVSLTSGDGPAITSALTASGTVGQPFSYQITATNSPTSFSAYPLPDGLSVDSQSGRISGTPTATGTYSVALDVANAVSGGYSGAPIPDGKATLTITISSASGGAVPTITSTTTAAAVEGQSFSYRITASHLTATNYAATGLPGGLSCDGATGLITGTPATGTAGVYSVLIEAFDANNDTAQATLTLTVGTAGGPPPAAHAPTITAPAGGIILVGEAFAYTITTAGDVAVDSFGATGLPQGLSVDAATGVLSGTVDASTAPGVFTVTLSATNGAGTSTTTRTFTVVTAPTGKAADVQSVFTNTKLIAPAGGGTTGKYKLKGNYTLSNLGRKPARNVALAVYLSTSPDFSFPAVADDPSLLQVPVYLDRTDPAHPALRLQLAGDTASTALIPRLGKRGAVDSTLGPIPFVFKVPAKLLASAAARYRYVLVVADPANAIKETDKSNNVAVFDLQQTP